DHVGFVSDDIVDRFCLVGSVDHQLRRLRELEALGVDQFAVYLQHDDKDGTLRQYGERVIPTLADEVLAKS
ncbi:MAG TPA: TIGR03842 family LLM class F420-dependent oxidoreductase, partial [Aquihabitans sp.]|nr:TIGR03842 family LLM class F420-dependent oxidoreductase [Aquihabitans sp.]